MASMTREHRLTRLKRSRSDTLNRIQHLPQTIWNREHKLKILNDELSSIEAAIRCVEARPESRPESPQPIISEGREGLKVETGVIGRPGWFRTAIQWLAKEFRWWFKHGH